MLNEEAVRAAKELARIAGLTDQKIVFVSCADTVPKRDEIELEDCFVAIVVRGDSKFWKDAQALVKKMQPLDEHTIRIYP